MDEYIYIYVDSKMNEAKLWYIYLELRNRIGLREKARSLLMRLGYI